LKRLETARADGLDISFDTYPYTAGSSHMLQLIPTSALDGGITSLLSRLQDPDQRQRIRFAVEFGVRNDYNHNNDDTAHVHPSKIAQIGWENVLICAVNTATLKKYEGMTISAAAQQSSMEPFDLLIHFLREDIGQTGIVMFQLQDDDVQLASTHPLQMFGSDGIPRPGTKPHPRAFGTFPRVVSKLWRQWKWIPTIEDAVRRMTSAPATRFRLWDRGVIRVGLAADIVIFDGERTDDTATYEDSVQLAVGISHVIVNGQLVISDGAAVETRRRPGKVLS